MEHDNTVITQAKVIKENTAEETVTDIVTEEKAAEMTTTENADEVKATEETTTGNATEENTAEETTTDKAAEEKIAEEITTAKAEEEKTAEETVIENTEVASDPSAEMKKLKFKKSCMITGVAALAVVGVCIAAYCHKAQDYIQRFTPGTSLNGVDVSDLSVAEAEELMKEKTESYTISVSFPGGTEEILDAKALGLNYVPDSSIQEQLDAQNPYSWGGKFLGISHDLDVPENYTWDEKELQKSLESLPEFTEGNYVPSRDATMKLTEDNQFELVKETYGTELDADLVMAALAENVDAGNTEITLDETFYILPKVYSDDKDLLKDIEDNNQLLSSKITYTLHDKTTYEIGADQMKDWLTEKKDEPDHYYIDEKHLKKKVEEAVADLAEVEDCKFNTYELESTKRGTRTFGCAEYGCTIDQEAEAKQLMEDVLAGKTVERTPLYSQEYVDPRGDTYVEVDIANQTVYMYKKGKLILTSSCVTGTDTVADRRSDRGFFHVSRINKNYTMRGPADPDTGLPSYESFVNFAVFYNRGEALHDASWRSSFGGNTYLYSGSHGCINMPYNAAKTVYENSFVGMPVFVY